MGKAEKGVRSVQKRSQVPSKKGDDKDPKKGSEKDPKKGTDKDPKVGTDKDPKMGNDKDLKMEVADMVAEISKGKVSWPAQKGSG